MSNFLTGVRFGNDPIHHAQYAIGKLACERRVGDHDKRHLVFPATLLKEFEDLVAGSSIKVARRFISEDKGRFFNDSTGYGYTLLFSS
jgi:hypothetical protein